MRTILAGLLFASLICATSVSEVLGGTDIALFTPRTGEFLFDSLSLGQYVQAADVNEISGVVEVPDSSFGVSVIDVSFGSGATVNLDLVTDSPACLDCGDYAFAVAIFDDPFGFGIESSFVLDGFFQLRLAGSNATVQDSSLAEAAVAAGLWTSVDDYIEFFPSNAGISAANATGPADFDQFPIPEPGSLALAALSATLVGCKRIRC